MTLLEEISFVNIISINFDPKSKNIVNASIREEYKKESIFEIFKRNKNNFKVYTIAFDFPSSQDSKIFIKWFKLLRGL